MAKHYQPEQIHLSNGIPVILQNYDSPVAATYWWVRVGSADEAPREAGFAHFLEHMLFKDASAKETGRASTGQMARVIESLGGDINAYTSFDQTVYHVTSAAQHWERVLDAFGTIAKPQKFLVKDFQSEREVILEELRKNEDSPGRQLFQSLFSATFSKHPYGRPVIGFVKTLKAAKTSELDSFYRRNYVSEKMGLILVGPIEDAKGTRKKNIIRLLEKHLGSKVIRSAKGTVYPRPVEQELRTQADWRVKGFDVKTPTISFSFRVPDLAHEDIAAIDLLSGILGMGELSRLHQRLFYQSALVTDVSGGLYVPKDPGMIYFQAEVDSMEKLKPTAEQMFSELKKISENGVTTEELNRVLASAESEKLYATQTADGMAGRLGFLKFIMGDLNFDREYLDLLRAVDSTKIKEVASKYFTNDRLSGVVLVPKAEEKFDVTEIADLAARALEVKNIRIPESQTGDSQISGSLPKSGQNKKSKKPSDESGFESFKLPSGLEISINPRPQSHVVSVHAAALGGVRLEIANPVERAQTDWGSSYMMAMLWTKGTSHQNASEISAITEGKASSIDGFAGRNSVGLQLTGLAKDWLPLSGLFTNVLLDPIFPKDEVEHVRRIAEDSVRSVDDHSAQLCSKLFLESLFENHPYGRMTHGSLESLQVIQSEKLQEFHRRWIRPERLVISISGPVKRAALESWISQLDQRAHALAQKHSSMNIPDKLENESTLKAPRWVERPLGREQCHILVGGLGSQIHAEDRHAIRILQTLLGGQSGRLFIELREKKSLAYTVSPVSFEGIERGYMGTYIACAPPKKDEAIAGIRTVLEKLVQKGPTSQEMNRAKEFFLGRRAMDLQSDTALASHHGLEGLYKIPHITETELNKRIRAVTPKEIQKVCQKYLVDPHMVTSVVG